MTFPIGIQTEENKINNLLITENPALNTKVNTDINAIVEFMKIDPSDVEKCFANPLQKNAREENYYSVILKTRDNKMYSFSYMEKDYI